MVLHRDLDPGLSALDQNAIGTHAVALDRLPNLPERFHVSGAPPLAVGGDMKRDFGGPVLLAEGVIRDTDGNPIPGAEIDIWQTAPNGLYASQDAAQDTFSFHGLMTVGADGRYAFTTVKPVEYTVPTDGPVGDILRACGRHPWRPSHLPTSSKHPVIVRS